MFILLFSDSEVEFIHYCFSSSQKVILLEVNYIIREQKGIFCPSTVQMKMLLLGAVDWQKLSFHIHSGSNAACQMLW
jgi:hypothetical protein